MAEIEREKEAGEFTVDLTMISTASKPMFQKRKGSATGWLQQLQAKQQCLNGQRGLNSSHICIFNERLPLLE